MKLSPRSKDNILEFLAVISIVGIIWAWLEAAR